MTEGKTKTKTHEVFSLRNLRMKIENNHVSQDEVRSIVDC